MPFRKFLFAENCILDSGVWWGFLSGCAPAEKVSIFSSKCHPPFQKNYQRAVQWKIEAIYAHFFPPGKKKVIGECRKVSSRLEWHQTTPLRDFPASQVKKKNCEHSLGLNSTDWGNNLRFSIKISHTRAHSWARACVYGIQTPDA